MAAAGAIEPLVSLLSSSKGREAASAAWALTLLTGNCAGVAQSVVDAGAIGPLVGLLASSKGAEAEVAAEALRSIANESETRSRAIAESGGGHVLE